MGISNIREKRHQIKKETKVTNSQQLQQEMEKQDSITITQNQGNIVPCYESDVGEGHVGGSYAAADCEDSGCSIHGGGGGDGGSMHGGGGSEA